MKPNDTDQHPATMNNVMIRGRAVAPATGSVTPQGVRTATLRIDVPSKGRRRVVVPVVGVNDCAARLAVIRPGEYVTVKGTIGSSDMGLIVFARIVETPVTETMTEKATTIQ